MTPEELEAIEARANKATKGPWAKHPALAQVDAFGKGYPLPVCQFLWPTDERTEDETEANEVFVAAARQDVPDLIAEVRRLREEARTFARIAAIDRLFDDAKSWGSWMVTASNERKGLVNRLNCSGYSIPHKHTTDAS